MVNKYLKIIIVAFVLMISNQMFAQEVPPDPDEPDLPIDGGVVGLFVLGAGYAVKKIHDKSKL